jgi:hypothetical protein
MEKISFGRRAVIYRGSPDLRTILQEEVEGRYIKRVQHEARKRREMLVLGKGSYLILPLKLLINLVSGAGELRDKLRDLVRGYLDEKVELAELEYQTA